MGVSPSAFNIDNCTAQDNIDTIILTPENATSFEYSPFEETLIRYILPVILFVCLLGNFTFFFTVYRVKRMRTTTNLYLMNLSIADILFLSVIVGEKNYRYYKVGVPSYGDLLGTWGCAIIYMTVYTTYFAAIIIVTLISVERYFAICTPLKHMVIWSKRWTLRALALSWFISMLLAGSMMPGYVKLSVSCIIWPQHKTYIDYPSTVGKCGAYGTGSLAFENFVQTVPFFVAIAANAVFYAGIILKMKERARNSRENSFMMRAKLIQVRNQVSRMLVVNGTVFFCCQAPYEIGCLVFFVQAVIYETTDKHTDDFLLNDDQYRVFLWVARLLLYINAMVNPLIFNSTSPTYRRALRAAFTPRPNKLKTIRSSNMFDDGLLSSEAITWQIQQHMLKARYFPQRSQYSDDTE